jgi:hypothetical protein
VSLDRFGPALGLDPHYRVTAVALFCVSEYGGGVGPLPRYFKSDDDAGLFGRFHEHALVVSRLKIRQHAPIGTVLDSNAQLPDRFAALVADNDADARMLTHDHSEEIEKKQSDGGRKSPGRA